MKEISKSKYSFGRHGSFLMKYSWLPKGFWAMEEDAGVFAADDATVRLGVGKNMVDSIRYWLQATGMINFQDRQATATPMGEQILSKQAGCDKYLEDDATLWLLHYGLARNKSMATSIYWLFNHFAKTVFTADEAIVAIRKFIEASWVNVPSLSTLKMDVATVLRMYAPHSSKKKQESAGIYESPMASLRLMTFNDGQYVSLPSNKESIPSGVFLYAMTDVFTRNKTQVIPIRDLMYSNDYVNLGSIFRLTEDGLVHHIEQAVKEFPNEYSFREDAGIQQVYRMSDRPSADYIAACYGQRVQ